MNKKDNKPEVNINLIRKNLQKKCTHKERELISKWFTDIRYERKLKYIIREHWDEIELESPDYDMDSDRLLDKLHHLINLDTYSKSRKLPFYRKAYQQLSKIAAVLLLPILVISAWYFMTNGQLFAKEEKTNYVEIFSPLAARTRFELPDGTIGWLNSGSTLKFPVRFKGKQREVVLSGEGFFKVMKDPEKPFIVKTSNMDIKALGTSFNVLAYPDDETCEITLESGKVIIEKTMENGKSSKLVELQPNHQVVISKKTYKSVVREVSPSKYTSWKEGKLVFRNDPMNLVVKKIGRWYNVNINLQDKDLESYRFRATFEDETFTEVMKLLKLTSPIDYVEHQREMMPDGTFTKKKITLFIKPGYNIIGNHN